MRYQLAVWHRLVDEPFCSPMRNTPEEAMADAEAYAGEWVGYEFKAVDDNLYLEIFEGE